MASGKCPKCDKSFSEIKAEAIVAKSSQATFDAVLYVCPLCNTIISAGVNPYALVQEIKKIRP